MIGEAVAVPRVPHGLFGLNHLKAEVERVAAEDVAHVVAADDDHLESDFFRDGLQAGRAHLPRRADRETIAGDEERLARVDALAEIRHQVSKRSLFPFLIEGVKALRHAVGGRRDLIGVDGVQFLPGALRVPEDERSPLDDVGEHIGSVGAGAVDSRARPPPSFLRAGSMVCMVPTTNYRENQKGPAGGAGPS